MFFFDATTNEYSDLSSYLSMDIVIKIQTRIKLKYIIKTYFWP